MFNMCNSRLGSLCSVKGEVRATTEAVQGHKGWGIGNVLSRNSGLWLNKGTEKKTFPSQYIEGRWCKVWGEVLCLWQSGERQLEEEEWPAATCLCEVEVEADAEVAAAGRRPSAERQERRPAWRSRWSECCCGAEPGGAGCWASTAASPGLVVMEPPCRCRAPPPPAREGSEPGTGVPCPAWRLGSQYHLDEGEKLN